MATVKKLFVFVTCLLSGIGVLFSVVSTATQHWVYSDKMVYTTINNTGNNMFQTVKYGLFEGSLKTTFPSDYMVVLTMTCLAKENVCAYLCAKTTEARYTLLKNLYNNENGLEQRECPGIAFGLQYHNEQPIPALQDEASTNRKFTNCGVWVTTILFLGVSMLFGLISSALSMYNTVTNPVQVFLSIYGIYLYNAIALFSLILAMLLYGVMYNMIIFHNVGVFYTLNGSMSSDKTAHLGYSYWLNIAPLILYASSIAVLYIRQFLISKDPGHKIVQREDDGDPVIYLY